MRLFEHAVGFADAGGAAEINLQGAFLGLRDQVEESFWIAAMLLAILFHGGVVDARTISNLVVFQIRMVKPPITMRVPPISVRKDGRSRKISAASIWEIRKNATM